MAEKYLRLTLNERVQHLNLFINFTILVITGFALKYPEAFWASPIADVPLGMTFRGLLHRLSGVDGELDHGDVGPGKSVHQHRPSSVIHPPALPCFYSTPNFLIES